MTAQLNIDRILGTLSRARVDYLLIGGVNYLLRHEPVMTFDVDVWIDDRPENHARCEQALAELDAAWGETDTDWALVAQRPPGWLARQAVFCFTTPHGALDVFRAVTGLDDWAASRQRAVEGRTTAGVTFFGLSDEDMLRTQEALPESARKPERIRRLRRGVNP